MRRVIGFTKNNNIIKAKVSCERVSDNKDPNFLVEFYLFRIANTEDTIRNYDYMLETVFWLYIIYSYYLYILYRLVGSSRYTGVSLEKYMKVERN